MKYYFKVGISLLIPVVLVVQVVYWGYSFIEDLIIQLMPTGTYHWWYVFIALAGALLLIWLMGFVFSMVGPFQWVLDKIERVIINRIPVVNKIYGFGKEVSDSFITDIKNDGDIQVVEVVFAGRKSLGALTDVRNNIVFVPTAPNPLNGFIIKSEDYKKLDMTFMELVQALASLGRVNGAKWYDSEDRS